MTLLAVPNLSEGRDAALVARIAGPDVLDVHSDPDHNRSVLTYGGEPAQLVDALAAMIDRAAAALDLRTHEGVHPRFGIVDVLPFVPYRTNDVVARNAVGDLVWRVSQGAGIPVHLYGRASPTNRPLPDLRRELRSATAVHPSAGVICIGIRDPLIAFNVNLDATLAEARRIANELRRPGVRALGLELRSRGLVQVSMNLIEPSRVGPLEVFTRVRERSDAIVDAEIVGLVPDDVLSELAEIPLRSPARGIEAALTEPRPG